MPSPDLTRFPPDLLDRYLAGKCSAEEQRTVERWLMDNGAASAVVEAIERWAEMDVPTEAWLSRVKVATQRAGATEDRPLGVSRTRFRVPSSRVPLTSRRTWFLGATVGLGVALAVVGTRVARQEFGATRLRASQVSVHTTRSAQRAAVRLPDGTRVTLAPSTSLRVTGRTVVLSGEALFSVADSLTTPFIVMAHGTVTRVLGTQFSVKAYDGDGTVRVAVAEGRVAFSSAPDSARTARAVADPGAHVLSAGDLVVHTPTGTRVQRGADIASALAWAGGELRFRETPLGDAVRDISRWYDIDLRLGTPALARERLTATFHGEALSQVLQLVARPLDLAIERNGRVVVLRGKHER